MTPEFDPTAPFAPPALFISSDSICRKLYARAYAEPRGQGRKHGGNFQAREKPTLDQSVAVFDTETVEHRLTFGVVEIYENRKLTKLAVFYADDLPAADVELLRGICKELGIKRLVKREWLFQNVIWPARRRGCWTIAAFNAPYDFSRIADAYGPATKTWRLGARFCGGFAFEKHFKAKGVSQKPVFARFKRDDRYHVRTDMRGACVLDVATFAHAYTDQSCILAGACELYGVPFEDRPGLHSGEITKKNVEGCLYDVRKTSELLWAVEREHLRHAIDVHPTAMQSGAAGSKGYLRKMGVRPRLEVQPDFPKEYLGYAAQAYIGGRVEAPLVNQPFPCAFDDFTSMYVTSFSLTDLWKWVTAGRLEIVDVDPTEVTVLLEQIRDNPGVLLDPATWPQLAFFALVRPWGEYLPARVDLPDFGLSIRERTAVETARIYDESMACGGAFWDALDSYGGKVVPHEHYDAKRKNWVVEEEFANLPRGLVKRNRKRSVEGFAHGNIDEITQSVRDATGDDSWTTSEVIECFAKHDRPSNAAARQKARELVDRQRDSLAGAPAKTATSRCITNGPVFSKKIPLWYAGHDLARAAIKGGVPEVYRAWRLRPVGVLPDLKEILIRGDDRFDPRKDDFWRRLIELRKRKGTDPDPAARKHDEAMRKSGYKCIGLSGAYGIFAETNPIELDPDDNDPKLRQVTVYADTMFETEVTRPERHGLYNFFPIASLVTAGARLLLSVYFKLVEDAGGTVGYCDTDSGIVVATEHGGLMPCEGGPHRMPDGRPAVKALSWAQLDKIHDKLNALNPYDPAIVPDLLKVEDENYVGHNPDNPRRELRCFAVSEKLYALYTEDESGAPPARGCGPQPGGEGRSVVIERLIRFGLGAYNSPVPVPAAKPKERSRWIEALWIRKLREAQGETVAPFAWERYPATQQVALSTWSVIRPYIGNKKIGPFDFLAVATIVDNLHFNEKDVTAGRICCEGPRPATMRIDDPATWKELEWFCLRCGAPWPLDDRPAMRTYGYLVKEVHNKTSRKRLRPDGGEGRSTKVGLTIPRPVYVEQLHATGKEVPIRPSQSEEEDVLTRELDDDGVLDYVRPEDLEVLRDRIKAAGIRTVARESNMSLSVVWEFVNKKTAPHPSTIAKLWNAIATREKKGAS